jgi:hypothetical protein
MRMQLSYSLIAALSVTVGLSAAPSLAGEPATSQATIDRLHAVSVATSQLGPDLEGLLPPAPPDSPLEVGYGASVISQMSAARASNPVLTNTPSGVATAWHTFREKLVKLARLNLGRNGAFRRVGVCQYGAAAWYGGRYIGRQTTSGSRLDVEHATAAHRSLPLNSLARVTRLDNGRSVVVRITDRGPVSHQLLIDMSPKAADELDMKQAGVVRVAVEQLVEVPPSER